MLEYGWGNLEHDYMVIILGEGWSLSDFLLMTREVTQMLTLVEQNTHILIDLRYAGTPPSNFMVVAGKFFEKLPSTVQSTIMINSTSFWKSLFQVTHDIYAQHPSHLYSVSTVQDAYKLIVSNSNVNT